MQKGVLLTGLGSQSMVVKTARPLATNCIDGSQKSNISDGSTFEQASTSVR